MTTRAAAILVVLVFGIVGGPPAFAYDAKETFKKGTLIASMEGGYGEQNNIESHGFQSGMKFYNAGMRLSMLPFDPILPGPLWGSLEVGLEPYYQQYIEPHPKFFAGLGAEFKYHFLSLGRFVPYVELFGAAGYTDLEVREISSSFTFLVHGGVGVEYFVEKRTALYVGYRLQHVSNGNTSRPNRGFESNTGVVGVSVFFP
jgi:lipid A 3-O-deacylase